MKAIQAKNFLDQKNHNHEANNNNNNRRPYYHRRDYHHNYRKVAVEFLHIFGERELRESI
jgi:hypothetical protein